VGVGPTRSEAAVEPLGGAAFEPLISKEARSLVPSLGRILFGVSPFPGPCCKREKEEKRKGYEIERRGVPFLVRLFRRRRNVARLSCQERRLSCRGVNATGRVVGGAAVARARAVRGTAVSLHIFESCVRSGRNVGTGLASVFIYPGEGLVTVLCSASCLPLRFLQPERPSQRRGRTALPAPRTAIPSAR
jgi:hypothetical protein